jgi:hypothetical protein
MVLATFCVLVPSLGWAQTAQEKYLPSKSQLYFRWDGMMTHQADFDKTAVGKMMKGETGKFLEELWKYVQEQGQNAGRNDPKIADALKDLTKLASSMYQYGLVLGVAVDQITPQPDIQAVLVFPKAAGESGTVLQLIDKIGEQTKADVKTKKVGKRRVLYVQQKGMSLGWWAEGPDAVLYFGTTDPVAYAEGIDGKKTGLANHPLYQKVLGFKEFPTCTRGYFDMTSVLNLAADIQAGPIAIGPIINELGLKGIKHTTFFSGFDGLAERSIVDVEMAETRTGLLKLTSQKKISLKDLPVLPSDVTGFSASSVNLSNSYGVITQTAEGIIKVAAPDQLENIKAQIKAIEGVIGKDFDIDRDLFGTFGDVTVSYNSPTDGFLGTGGVVAVQLKDGKKLEKTLNRLVKAIPPIPGGGEVILKRKSYRGGEIYQLQLDSDKGNFHIASLGIYKNWFIYTAYPQPIKGFILRQEGELPAWKVSPSLAKAMAPFPKEFTSIKVSDPRPTVRTVLAITPFVLNYVNFFGTAASREFIPGFRPFDLELIPHPQEATMHLFPNVTISTDNGKRIRTETRSSLNLPF